MNTENLISEEEVKDVSEDENQRLPQMMMWTRNPIRTEMQVSQCDFSKKGKRDQRQAMIQCRVQQTNRRRNL